ncbi:hypothetical protein BH160DRAFT_0118 [Burkholderia sp. H160]|nr:hypothetical protein BH160DRAFT_0118 [Burkholderia sp. H160]
MDPIRVHLNAQLNDWSPHEREDYRRPLGRMLSIAGCACFRRRLRTCIRLSHRQRSASNAKRSNDAVAPQQRGSQEPWRRDGQVAVREARPGRQHRSHVSRRLMCPRQHARNPSRFMRRRSTWGATRRLQPHEGQWPISRRWARTFLDGTAHRPLRSALPNRARNRIPRHRRSALGP